MRLTDGPRSAIWAAELDDQTRLLGSVLEIGCPLGSWGLPRRAAGDAALGPTAEVGGRGRDAPAGGPISDGGRHCGE